MPGLFDWLRPSGNGLLNYQPDQGRGIFGYSPDEMRQAFWGPERNLIGPAAQWALENVVPGSSDAVALKDAYDASGRMTSAIGAGEYGAAAREVVPFLASSLAILPAVPSIMRGIDDVSGAARRVDGDFITRLLDQSGLKYRIEDSRGFSDAHGPSASKYFHVETPAGIKTVRLSDHDWGSGKDADIRYGAGADQAELTIRKALGLDLPPHLKAMDDAATATRQQQAAALLQRQTDDAALLAQAGFSDVKWQNFFDQRDVLAALRGERNPKKAKALLEAMRQKYGLK